MLARKHGCHIYRCGIYKMWSDDTDVARGSDPSRSKSRNPKLSSPFKHAPYKSFELLCRTVDGFPEHSAAAERGTHPERV